MGFLKDQAIRLLRTNWSKKANLLGQELFAMFNAETPFTIDGPVVINNTTDQPPLIIRQFGPYDAGIRIERMPQPDPAQLPGFVWPGGDPSNPQPGDPTPGVPISGMPGVTEVLEIPTSGQMLTLPGTDGGPGPAGADGMNGFYIPSADGTGPPAPLSQNPNATTINIQGGGGMPGQVVSGGPGSSYLVNVYSNGLAGGFITVSVTQLQIHEDATIPAGTWAIVVQAGGSYYMQVPIWLE